MSPSRAYRRTAAVAAITVGVLAPTVATAMPGMTLELGGTGDGLSTLPSEAKTIGCSSVVARPLGVAR